VELAICSGGRWRIIDPFLAEWLRRNSPFGD